MATPVEAPKLGNTVEECLVSRWVKRKGETVSAGELVLEIETDKATFEVTSPVNGTLLETFFDEGAFVPVFTMPGWLQAFARNQPVTAVVDASRALMVGGPTTEPVIRAVLWSVGLLVVLAPLAVSRYRRAV